MTDERIPPGDPNLDNSDLEAAADAILEGAPVDWARLDAASDPDLVEQLRVLSDLATVHRAPNASASQGGEPSRSLGPWGPLTLLERIGQGAFGEVYRAWDARLDREVALKLLHRDSRESPDQPRRSIEEGRLLARVRHPNVVTVYGADSIDGRTGIWTEFVAGQTLSARLRERGPLVVEEATAIGVTLCRALAAAHAVGLVHRDIKADNVMCEPSGRIVLLDFGASQDFLQPGRTPVLTGTPLYLAPELWTGGSPSVKTDIYSLGVLLYYLVTGSYPVKGTSIEEIRKAHESQGPTALALIAPELPPAFASVVDRAIAADPSHRFDSPRALESALAGSQDVGGDVVTPGGPRSTERRAVKRAAVILAGAAVVATLAAVLLVRNDDADRRPPVPTAPVLPRNETYRASPIDGEGTLPATESNDRAADGALAQHAAGSRSTGADAVPRPSPLPPTFHNIRIVDGGVIAMGVPSRDGRYVPYVDGDGNLVVWEKPTGRRRVVVAHQDGEGNIGPPLMSPDGDRIVFEWSVPGQGHELRMVVADGSNPRMLLARQPELTPLPTEWSKDGRWILCWLRKDSNQYWDLSLVPVEGGPSRLVQHFDAVRPVRASLSADARFVVYDMPQGGPRTQRDLFIAGTDGSPPRVLVDGETSEERPLWTPQDRYVFFQRSGAGSYGGWIVPVADGVATGPPRLVANEVSAVTDWTITEDGALYYPVEEPFSEDLAVEFDQTGKGPPGGATPFASKVHGTHSSFAWAPRGDSVAFVVSSPRTGFRLSPHPFSLWIQQSGSQVPQTFPLDGALAFAGDRAPRWAPDGRSLAVWGRSRDGRWGYFRLDATTGASTPLFLVNAYRLGLLEWAPDGATLFFFDPAQGIVARNLASDTETIAVGNAAWPSGQPGMAVGFLSFAVSPDGRSIGVAARGAGGRLALILQRLGGETRTLVDGAGPGWLEVHGWTPDGHGLIYSEARTDTNRRELWRVAAEGGQPQRLLIPPSLESADIRLLSLSPDGRRLGYTGGGTVWDLCILEHFLPPDR